MNKILKVEARTEQFIEALKRLKELNKLPSNAELAKLLGISSPATISEIKGRRQNIQPESWKKFLQHYSKEIPLYQESEETKTADPEPNYINFSYKEKYINQLEEFNQVLKKQLELANSRSDKLIDTIYNLSKEENKKSSGATSM